MSTLDLTIIASTVLIFLGLALASAARQYPGSALLFLIGLVALAIKVLA